MTQRTPDDQQIALVGVRAVRKQKAERLFGFTLCRIRGDVFHHLPSGRRDFIRADNIYSAMRECFSSRLCS